MILTRSQMPRETSWVPRLCACCAAVCIFGVLYGLLPARAAQGSPAGTAESAPLYPAYRYLPDEENWQIVCERPDRFSDPFDPVKCISLAQRDPAKYLSLGADIRFRYEHYFNKQWDPRQWSSGYVLQRESATIDLHEDRVRAFVQLEHSNALFAHPPSDPTWTDTLAATSAYLEIAIGGATGAPAPPLAIRAGRQLVAYGSQRMIDDRFGLNTLQPFDGIRARFTSPSWRTDLFWLRPVIVAPGSFDNHADKTRSLFGTYATRAVAGGSIDAYGLIDQRQSQFAWRGAQPEVRWTIGTRYAAGSPHLDADTEADYQFGSFGGAPIAAFALETNAGYSWGRPRDRYRFGIGGGYATGDHGARGTRFTEFAPPYPTGLTFGIVQANGSVNTAGFTPNFTYSHGSLTVSLKDYFYYRQSSSDGLYVPANLPLRSPAGSNAAPIGNLGFVSLTKQLDRHAALSAAYARYLTGPFLEESGPASSVPSASTTYYSAAFEYRM